MNPCPLPAPAHASLLPVTSLGQSIRKPGGKGARQLLCTEVSLLGSEHEQRWGAGLENSHTSALRLVFCLDVPPTKPELAIASFSLGP